MYIHAYINTYLHNNKNDALNANKIKVAAEAAAAKAATGDNYVFCYTTKATTVRQKQRAQSTREQTQKQIKSTRVAFPFLV